MNAIKAIMLAALVLLTLAPASVAQTGPGMCLTINNQTAYTLTIWVKIPSVYDNGGTWTFEPGELAMLYFQGNPVFSTYQKNRNGGHFWIEFKPDGAAWTWSYDADRNTSRGCKGTWTATAN